MSATRATVISLITAVQMALAAASVVADQELERSETLRIIPMPVIEVVGKQPEDISRLTGSIVLMDREQIDMIQPLSTEDALRRIPGINIKSEEETSIVSNFGLRGLSASESKSLMLEDGVPVAPGLFIGNERYFNPRIQRVDTIEVLKGSASLRYGPSTIGGVVNYQTKTPTEGLILSVRGGSFNLRETSVEAGVSNLSGDAFIGIVGTVASSDGYMDKGYDMRDVMVKSGIAVNEQHTVGLKISHYSNDANISYRGLLLNDYRNGADYNPAPDDYFLTERDSVDLSHEWRLSEAITLKSIAYYSEVYRDYWRYNVDTQASTAMNRWIYTDTLTGNNRSFDRTGLETRLSIDHAALGFEQQTEFGLRYMEEASDDTPIRATRESDRAGINDRHRIDSAESIAAYGQTRIELTSKLALTPGLRIESYKQTRVVLTDDNAAASTKNTEYLPGVGATFQLSNKAQLFGGVYKAFSPASNGVALDGLVDQQLDGERSINTELGVRGLTGSFNYELALFHMDFDNQVITGNSDPNLSQSNSGKTTHEGAELTLGWAIAPGLSVDANATWVPHSEFDSGDYQGNRLPYAPEWLANLTLNYEMGNLSSAVMLHYRGDQFGDPSNQIQLPTDAAGGIWGGRLASYTLVDWVSQYRVSAKLSLFGSVKNLTDKRYMTGLRQGIYAGPERSMEVGATYSF